mmetsp:Transcript_14802/g.24689  ORF Transcript_14802/g.24689 Transcript_14802/m.24689 type:complete len:130 (+) Transcript_14802:83-472(+)
MLSSSLKHDQVALCAVRTYLEENLPDHTAIDERSMFGCHCFIVRGHIFIALKYDGSRLLVRVGTAQMEAALQMEGASAGPIQSVWVTAQHFKGNDRFSRWYELALAFNMSQVMKEPNESRPGKKRKKEG